MDIIFIDAFHQSSIIKFPIGINLLSTIVNTNSNYTSKVISFPNLLAEKKVPNSILLEKDYETIVRYILNNKPKIISFYTMENSYFISLIVAQNIKKIDESIKIIFAGPHVSLCSLETLETFDFIDMIAIGEGEQNIISIIDYFNNREKIENIKGICYRKSDKIICNLSSPLLENLDELPMLELNDEDFPLVMPIETGRGCPYNCTFCCTKTFWKRKVRLKSTDRLVREIEYYMNKYKIRKFNFVHDLFTANKRNILEFCNRIVDLGIDIEWFCSARTDTLDEETMSLMARAGCNKVLLGIETGSQRMQKEINKYLNVSQIKDTIRLLARYNIKIQASFIYGFPTEKDEDLLESLNLIRFCVEDMLIQELTIYKCRCYPSTQIYFTQKDNLTFNEEDFYLFKHPAKNHADFIKRYPKLFSSLFILNKSLIDKYFYLDIFMNETYNFFAFRIPKTMGEIIKFYNNSLLDFYLEYEDEMKRITDLLTRTIYYDEKLSDVREEMWKSLENFIKNNIKNDFISDLYRFEVEIIRISPDKTIEHPEAHIFDYDMLLYYQKFEKKKERCKLFFSVTKDKDVCIYKGGP